MPTNEDFSREYLRGPARDPRTGATRDERVEPLTDEDRRLRRTRDRDRWISAVSVPPPSSSGRDKA